MREKKTTEKHSEVWAGGRGLNGIKLIYNGDRVTSPSIFRNDDQDIDLGRAGEQLTYTNIESHMLR